MVLLNLDAGEYASEPEELWTLADILCVACGGHAGDEASMTRVVRFCAARQRAGLPGPRLGAHPSYPDRAHFGRLSRAPQSAAEVAALSASLSAQCKSLQDIALDHRVLVEYVKPHGALYHDAARDDDLARSFVLAARTGLATPALAHLTFIGPPTGALEANASSNDHYLREGFADRRARADGTLVPRSEPDALITDPAAAVARARELLAAGAVDTICCHADTPGSLAILTAVRAAVQLWAR